MKFSLFLFGGVKLRELDLVMGLVLIFLKYRIEWDFKWLVWIGEEGSGKGD